MGLLSFKNFLIINILAFGVQMIHFYMTGRLKAFIEKPEQTIYPGPCVMQNCLGKTFNCMLDGPCRRTVDCIDKCTINVKVEQIAACAYICEMDHGYANTQFLDLINCMLDNQCLADYPRDGICYGNDEDGVPILKDLNQIKGDWWVIYGLNCGYDFNRDFPGGYDWYPCQHERFIQNENGQWINNVTFCNGKLNECTSPIINTMANISLPVPGVVKHEYIDAPLAPQTERWRIVSWPNQGDYLFMLWCGNLPILEYNGGIILSRHRNDKNMPKETLNEFKRVAGKFGLTLEDLCPSDNTNCPV